MVLMNLLIYLDHFGVQLIHQIHNECRLKAICITARSELYVEIYSEFKFDSFVNWHVNMIYKTDFWEILLVLGEGAL